MRNDEYVVSVKHMSEKHAFIMMVKDKWWQEFRRLHNSGRNVHSYVRKGKAPPKKAKLLFFYVTKPNAEIAGYAEFIERKVGDSDELWKQYKKETVLKSKKQYLELIQYSKQASFIRFKDLHEAEKPIPLNNLQATLSINKPARRGFYINEEKAEKLISQMK